MNDVIGMRARARALEESFFERENQELLRKLRERAAREDKKRMLREALSYANDEILDALVDLDLDTESVVAFGLVPLVEVAWADGEIQPKERDAIIKAAIEQGVEEGSPTCDLLRNWLQKKPDARLLEVWKGYIDELKTSLGDRSKEHLKSGTLGRARAIAEAAGGFLGVASISAAEKKMLDELEWSFD
jgi:hypothetical protein